MVNKKGDVAGLSNLNIGRIKLKIETRFVRLVSNFHLKPFGIQGLFLGILLGFIPCGLVFANISTVINTTDQLMVVALAMFVFGIGTIPGLFLISYAGSQLLTRYKHIFSTFYIANMFFNAYLLFLYMKDFFD